MNLKRSLLLIFILASINVFSQKEDYVKFGGALRYNIHNQSWNNDKSDPQFTWDTWRLNVDARTAGVDLSFEYRWYPAGNYHMLHHGYLGYGFTDNLYMKIGASQVPFGITKYASHSWWFQIPYYVGLEDDYDMGIKFDYTGVDNLTLNVAYFHSAEPAGGGNSANYADARYSYDIVGTADGSPMKEGPQFNVRAAYNITEGIEVGLSGQFGKNLYDQDYDPAKGAPKDFDNSVNTSAFAAHLLANFGNFNFKGEYITYDYGAVNNDGSEADQLVMGAYAAPYNVASKADIIVAGLAYSIPVEWGPISNLQPYVDYSVINKSAAGFEPTQHLVPGMLITAGSIYTYVDYAMGTNNAWLGSWTDGLAKGTADADWESRFNINIGYYF
jgi:hypothetical protein